MTGPQLFLVAVLVLVLIGCALTIAVQHARGVIGNMDSCFGRATREGDKDPDGQVEIDEHAVDRGGEQGERSA